MIFLTQLFAQIEIAPVPGVYYCFQGNNPDICEQRIEKIYQEENNITAIKLSYVGFCGDQGPYQYYCTNLDCSDTSIKIRLINSREYYWENTTYNFNCLMRKQ